MRSRTQEALSRIRYPDVSDILERKREGRRKLSKLTFGEKIARIEALRERLEPLKRAREGRQRRTPSMTDASESLAKEIVPDA